jgi:hypothetical protein
MIEHASGAEGEFPLIRLDYNAAEEGGQAMLKMQ